jgi:hypothetical protein
LVDAAAGTPLCSRSEYIVSTNRGDAIAHEETCEWWLPAWTPGGDAGAAATDSELVVTATGYRPESISIEIQRNECGEVQPPALVELQLEPAPAE